MSAEGKKMVNISDIKIPHGANVTDDELLRDLKKVVEEKQTEWLSEKEYAHKGQFAPNTIRNRFGSWTKALQRAGLNIEYKRKGKHIICPSREALIEDLQTTAKKLGKKTVNSGEYEQYGKYGRASVYNRYKTWRKGLEAAGLGETGFHNAGITKEQLLEAIYEAWERLGRQPNTRDVRNKEIPYGLTTYINQFGSWRNTMIAFVEYVKMRRGQVFAIPEISPIAHKTGRTPSAKLKKLIFERYNATCQQCGANERKEPGIKLVIDHIIPYSKGGETIYENLQILCRKCNIEKRNKMIHKDKAK